MAVATRLVRAPIIASSFTISYSPRGTYSNIVGRMRTDALVGTKRDPLRVLCYMAKDIQVVRGRIAGVKRYGERLGSGHNAHKSGFWGKLLGRRALEGTDHNGGRSEGGVVGDSF